MTLPISEQEGLNVGATILRPDLDRQMKALEGALGPGEIPAFQLLQVVATLGKEQ